MPHDDTSQPTVDYHAPVELADARILVVDDEDANTRAFGRLLKQAGFTNVETLSDPNAALRRINANPPDLLITDIRMPSISGLELLRVIQDEIHEEIFLPVMMITGDRDPHLERECLAAGAKEFVYKPFRASEIVLRIKNLLETRHLQKQISSHRDALESRVLEERARAIDAQLDSLRRLALAAELRDDLTGRHAERVGALAEAIAKAVGLVSAQAELLRRAAPLHDVGKIGIPDAILLKPGSLEPEEYEVMKTHTVIGARLLAKEESFPELDLAREIALSHHERFDGCGYPQGLIGANIPISGRIVAVADVFDSLTHERPYKRAFSPLTAVDLMESQRALHFDPTVLDAFMDLYHRHEIDAIVAHVDSGAGAATAHEPEWLSMVSG